MILVIAKVKTHTHIHFLIERKKKLFQKIGPDSFAVLLKDTHFPQNIIWQSLTFIPTKNNGV